VSLDDPPATVKPAAMNPFDPGYYCPEELRSFGFARVGENVLIAKNCTIIGPENIEIGDNVRVDAFTRLLAASGHIRLGRYVHVHTGCMFGGRGGIDIGEFSGISHGVAVLTATDDFGGHWMTSSNLPEGCTNPKIAPVTIGRHVPVGVNSAILPGVVIEDGAAVCAMSLVTKSLEGWTLSHGNPGRRVGTRERRGEAHAA
jgi:galactoside O-acetyltransferase